MKLITWNVNGLRACINKGFKNFMYDINSDIFCIQETKMQKEQSNFNFTDYLEFWNDAKKKGYSGTLTLSKIKPEEVSLGLGLEKYDSEGRVITAKYENFFLVNIYVPNVQRELTRLNFRMEWEDAFRNYVKNLDKLKPVIICGDMNVAHNEIDLKNPKTNVNNAGFTYEERNKMTELLSSGFIDSFRYMYPDKTGAFTWWSYMFNARKNNVGWRIDYFLVSSRIKHLINDVIIHNDVLGSDHCPVELNIDIKSLKAV